MLNQGRPSDYSEELAGRICSLLAEGQSLAKICRNDWAPSTQTVFTWMRVKPGFLDMYTRAKEESADYLADQIVEIADEAPPTLDSGATDSGAVQHQRLRVEARKWTAAKLKPKKYGDKLQAEHSGADGGPIKYTVVTGVPDQSADDRA